MSLVKLEKTINSVLKQLSKYPTYRNLVDEKFPMAQVKNTINLAHKILPEHEDFFLSVYNEIELDVKRTYAKIDMDDASSILKHILELIEIEKSTQSKLSEDKIFEGALEKMKQAGLSFRNNDYNSTLQNLNTSLELLLKDKLGIPTTITKINTSNIIEILVKYKIEPFSYLDEAKKRVILIDNKIKHQGYVCSKIESINALKAMEELISKLRDKEIKVTEEIQKKIYQSL